MSINITQPPAPPLQALALNQSARSRGSAVDVAESRARRDRPVWLFTPLQALTAILILVVALAVSLTLLAQQERALAAGVAVDGSVGKSSVPAKGDANGAAHRSKHVSGSDGSRNTHGDEGSGHTDSASDSAQHDQGADNASAGTADQTGRVNLNSASQEDLENVKGIGPVTAAKILEHRRALGGRYASVDQLLDVPGIGAKTLARLRPYLVVQ